MRIIHISQGGPDRVIVDRNLKRWQFEDHPYAGPTITNRDGSIKEKQPPEGSPFWEAVTNWAQQGKKVNDKGGCTWYKPHEPRLVHLGGKNYALEGSALAARYGNPEQEAAAIRSGK